MRRRSLAQYNPKNRAGHRQADQRVTRQQRIKPNSGTLSPRVCAHVCTSSGTVNHCLLYGHINNRKERPVLAVVVAVVLVVVYENSPFVFEFNFPNATELSLSTQ